VERLPAPGETVSGGGFATAPGGQGANQALAARRAGAEVRMVGAVGQDAFAREALALLDRDGVDLTCVRETHTVTGTALIMVDGKGENVIAVVPGSNASVKPGDAAVADVRAGEYLLLQLEIPLETVKAALDAAREAGAVTLLNCAPYRAEAAPLLALADYVIANETEFDLYAEALKLEGEDRPARMQAFCRESGRVLLVTLGADGLLAATPETSFHMAAETIEPVDTVGAGDTFCGYLAAGLAGGLPLDKALARASRAAALACLKPGAQPSIPRAADVDKAG
jgi:ribokinase